jgi:hypothetical protein
MIGPDEELQRLLKLWEAPAPSAELDKRVWAARRQSGPPRRWKWLPVAAGVILAVGLARFWSGSSGIETRVDATGFMPIPNGAITVVVKTGEKQ